MYVFSLTWWESVISALWLVSCAADGFQVDAVVGATRDASHQAVGVQGVALGMPTRGRQAGDVGACAATRWPGHVGHSLGDLGHADRVGATGTSGGAKREQTNSGVHVSTVRLSYLILQLAFNMPSHPFSVKHLLKLSSQKSHITLVLNVLWQAVNQSYLFPKVWWNQVDFSPQLL